MERTDETVVLTPGEAARKLTVSDSGLRAWRRSGKGPRFCRFGRSIRYLDSDLDAFIRASRVTLSTDHQTDGTDQK